MQIRNDTHVHKVCLTLQQWAFLFSVIVFVITAVLTTCAALGKIHTEDVWELIKADLAEEEEKSYYAYDKNYRFNQNQIKLQLSQHFVLMIIWILYMCTWIGCLNLSAAILMIYGIATKNAIYIIPWILISGTTCLLSMSTIIVAYFDILPGIYISLRTLAVSLTGSTLFISFWYIILLFYTSLTTNMCTAHHYPAILPTVIQAHNGYIHTINEKKEIV